MAEHDENVVWHAHPVTVEQREELHQHRGAVLWFTGLSGSGKSTVAGALEEALHKLGVSTYLLDGDNVRHGLCSDLGFSDADRKENIRRVGEVAKLMADAGLVVLTAFISPHRAERQMVREPQEEVYKEPSAFSAFELELNALVRRHFPHWGARDLLGGK